MTRALILSQGGGRRWETDGHPYLGRPKQLLEVDGETLVARAARLFAERGCEVMVLATDERMTPAHGVRVALDDPWPVPSDMAKFIGTQHLWSLEGRTLILWGDCFYSDTLADLIVNHPSDDLHYFRRPGPSEVTGCRWDESFAVSFGPGEHGRVRDLAVSVHGAWERRELRRRKGTHLPIRNHYAAAIGVPFDNRRALLDSPGQTTVDDWSDDIDSPAEYREWFGRHEAGRHKLAVCIPWFGGDKDRTLAWEFTRAWYEGLGVPVYVGDDDSGSEWTNRARGCNRAVRQAIADGAEVVLIGDADTVIPERSMWAGAHAARMTGQIIIGYTEYLKMARQTSRLIYGGRSVDSLRPQIRWLKHVSGAVFVTPELFELVGGFDERFTSWGGEDRAFWMACFSLGGGWHRIHGPAWHLWHERSPERAGTHPNRKVVVDLGRRYKRASGWLTSGGTLGKLGDADRPPDVDAMRALLSEPGGPLAGRLTDA